MMPPARRERPTRMHGLRVASVAAVAVLGFAVAACSSSQGRRTAATASTTAPVGTSPTAAIASNSPTSPARPTAFPTAAPTATGYPHGTTTGNTVVDQLADAFIKQDIARLLDLARYEQASCATTTTTDWNGPPPPCPTGVVPGTPVKFMTLVSCHGLVRGPDDLALSLRVVSSDIRLFAVAKAEGDSDPRAEYHVFFSMAVGREADNWGVEFVTGAGGFIHVKGGCGTSASQMSAGVPPTAFLLPPSPQ